MKNTHRELMLTVRMDKQLFNAITKTAARVALNRSDFVRTILQKSIDNNPLSYDTPKTKR